MRGVLGERAAGAGGPGALRGAAARRQVRRARTIRLAFGNGDVIIHLEYVKCTGGSIVMGVS